MEYRRAAGQPAAPAWLAASPIGSVASASAGMAQAHKCIPDTNANDQASHGVLLEHTVEAGKNAIIESYGRAGDRMRKKRHASRRATADKANRRAVTFTAGRSSAYWPGIDSGRLLPASRVEFIRCEPRRFRADAVDRRRQTSALRDLRPLRCSWCSHCAMRVFAGPGRGGGCAAGSLRRIWRRAEPIQSGSRHRVTIIAAGCAAGRSTGVAAGSRGPRAAGWRADC